MPLRLFELTSGWCCFVLSKIVLKQHVVSRLSFLLLGGEKFCIFAHPLWCLDCAPCIQARQSSQHSAWNFLCPHVDVLARCGQSTVSHRCHNTQTQPDRCVRALVGWRLPGRIMPARSREAQRARRRRRRAKRPTRAWAPAACARASLSDRRGARRSWHRPRCRRPHPA